MAPLLSGEDGPGAGLRPRRLAVFAGGGMSLSTRLTLAMVMLVLVTAAAVALLSYRNLEQTIMPRALERIEAHADLLAANLASYVASARADIPGFSSASALSGIKRVRAAGGRDPVDGTLESTWRARMAARYAAELAAKPAYSQFRIIGVDDGGREVVRVDRLGPNGTIRIVPDGELQRKGDRDYFRRAVALPDQAIYVSPIELNHGGSEIPHVSTLRIASAIRMPDGQPFGIVVINLDMRAIFARLRASAPPGTQVYLLNERGDYLMHPDPRREFASERGEAARWQDDFPELLTAAGSRDKGTFIIDAGGEPAGAALVWMRPADGPRVAVLEMVPRSVIMAPAAAIRHSTLLAGLGAIIAAAALALMVARSMTRPLVQVIRAVDAFARGQPAVLPADAAGELGVLATAFTRMMSEVQAKTTALEYEVEQHRHTEFALERHVERERLFSAAVESSDDAILTMTLDGMITGWNQAAENLYKVPASEAIGRSVRMLSPPDKQSEVAELYARVCRGEKVSQYETVRVDRNGRRIEVSLSLSPVKSKSGAIVGMASVARDITARKRAQQALLESEQTARGIIDTALDAFVQMDEDGRILQWNRQAEALFGWSRAEATGKVLGDLIVLPQRRVQHEDGLAQALTAGDTPALGKRFEMVVQRKDGKEITVELSVTALTRDTSCVFNWFIRDLTAKIAADDQLRQAQKMEAVGQLTGGVAHDFNNILTVITGTIEILADAVALEPDLAAIARMMDEAAARGASLTQGLLAFARRQPLDPRETDVNTLVGDVAKLLRPTLGEHIEVDAKLAAEAWPALVDPNQLTTALLNLALNARDAMPQGGKLMLETSNVILDEGYARMQGELRPGEYLMVAVSDNGCGIPPEVQEKVFEPFFSTKGVGRGTGLGLSMVYGFVKQSGGHIKLYSEVGHGTAIKLYVPRAVESADLTAKPSASAPIPGGNETILVVEDDILVRNYVTAQLHNLGYSTLVAGNAAEALALIDGGAKFDLLFTDVIMPGAMNGRDLAEAALERRPDLKVLFTSGYTEDAIVHHGRLDPGVLLLEKPYRKSELARMVRLAIGGAVTPLREARATRQAR
jgi:PAS domain S-box-containing protein